MIRSLNSKISSFVSFPINGLDLSEFVVGTGLQEREDWRSRRNVNEEEDDKDDKDEYIYDLFGVSNHMGGTGGGHCKGI